SSPPLSRRLLTPATPPERAGTTFTFRRCIVTELFFVSRTTAHKSRIVSLDASRVRYTLGPMAAITTLDLNWRGESRCIATALLRSDNFAALVDPGPGSTLETVRKLLAAQQLRVADLQAIFLTHIHLDHAAATGALVRENPALQVYVHSRGAPHMSDPSKLLSSAERLYGHQM